jgi:hypothetical protein
MKKAMLIEICLILCSLALIFQGCSSQNDPIDDMMKNEPHTIIVPNVVECTGYVTLEYFGQVKRTKLPMLVCDDGRVFHNITNYQDVVELNPLRQ